MESLLSAEAARPKAIGYCRVSSKKQVEDGGSLEGQREAIIREAVLGGFDLLDVYADEGVSGGKGERSRPGLSAALDSIRSGRAEALIVKHADRLSRDTDYAGHLRTVVKEAGAKLIVIEEVKNDPIRRAVDKMLAELERIRGSQRMKAWNAERRVKGLTAGPAPYGFEKGPDGRLVPDEARRTAVDRILRLRRKGRTLRAIADSMNAANVPAPRAGRWNAQSVLLILRREKLAAR